MHATTAPHGRRRLALLATTIAGLAAIVVPVAVFTAIDGDAPAPPLLGALDRLVESEPGVDDGALPDGPVSPYADVPAIANLDAELLAAVRSATDAAAVDGVELLINSGWRSAALQQQLRDDAIVTYGSQEEADRWVATPERSAHVTGDAVDVGGWDASSWLGVHGWAYGLCQTYANEAWHFELRPDAVAQGCPAMLDDPTHAH